jgi:hypothetical protein
LLLCSIVVCEEYFLDRYAVTHHILAV